MQGEEPRETWYQPEGFFYFLATSRESCRSGVERWDVWGWREWIRHKVYRPWTMAHEVFLTPPQRLDAERRLPLFWSVQSGMWDGSLVDFCLKKCCCSEAMFVCHLFYLYAPFLTDVPPLPHAEISHLTAENKAHAPLNKSKASQGNLIETLCDLWTPSMQCF